MSVPLQGLARAIAAGEGGRAVGEIDQSEMDPLCRLLILIALQAYQRYRALVLTA